MAEVAASMERLIGAPPLAAPAYGELRGNDAEKPAQAYIIKHIINVS
jgi:hypothetical protein